jgi:hypothetical protein
MGFRDRVREYKEEQENQKLDSRKATLPTGEAIFTEVLEFKGSVHDSEWIEHVNAYIVSVALRPGDVYGIYPARAHYTPGEPLAIAYLDRPEYEAGRARYREDHG